MSKSRVLTRRQLGNNSNVLDPELVASVQSIMARHVKPQSPSILMKDVAALAMARVRTPLKDLCPKIFPTLRQKDDLAACLSVMESAGRGMLFFEELFDFAFSQVDRMSGTQLASFVYECGRHGLRCKHYLDYAKLEPLVDRVGGNRDLCRFFQGVCKFPEEFSGLVGKMVHNVVVEDLSANQILIVLRVIRPLSAESPIFKSVLREVNVSEFSLFEKLNLLHLLKSTLKFRVEQNAQVGLVVNQVLGSILNSDLTGVTVTDITDAMDALASLRKTVKVDEKMLAMFMSFLTARVAEIRYSPICGLWQSVTDSLGHMRYFDGEWMKSVVEEIGSSPFQLKSFAAFQLIFFTSSLGRLNFYSPSVYAAVAAVVAADVSSIHDADMLATLLVPFARANSASSPLSKAVAAQLKHIATQPKKLDRKTIRGTLSAIQSILILEPNDLHHLEQLLDTMGPKMNRKLLMDNDYPKIFRIEAILAKQIRGVPKWVRESPYFTWHDNPHRQSQLAKKETGTADTKNSLVDLLLADGTPVLIDDEECMRQWKYPQEDKNYELEDIEISGKMAALKRIVEKQGFENVTVVHRFKNHSNTA